MKHAHIVSAALSVLSLMHPAIATATTAWHWTFDVTEVNLAETQFALITVVNDSSSETDIEVEGISLQSFGNLGLLYEPGFKGVITPTLLSSHTVLRPGEFTTTPAIQFHINPVNLPTPGVSYDILPSLNVIVGNQCTYINFDPAICSFDIKSPSESLKVVYLPVPEPSRLLEMLTGAIFLTSFLRFRHILKNPQAETFTA